MSKVLVIAHHDSDGAALQDLLTDDGHTVARAADLHQADHLAFRPDVLVADLEPWTCDGRALIERSWPTLATVRLVLLCARVPRGAAPDGMTFLQKPVALEALRDATTKAGKDHRWEAA